MRFHGIEKDSMLNGEGLRVVLWVSGCNHHCKGCHNPQTWDVNSGREFTYNDRMTLFGELGNPYISGFTASGGDPLHPANFNEVLEICEYVKDVIGKTTWVYTGYKWEEIKHLEGLKYVDVLVDGEFVQELADVNYPYAGSTNQSLIDVQKSLKSGCKIIYEVVQ